MAENSIKRTKKIMAIYARPHCYALASGVIKLILNVDGTVATFLRLYSTMQPIDFAVHTFSRN